MRDLLRCCLMLFGILIILDGSAQSFKIDDYKKAQWMTGRSYGAQRSSLKTGATTNWLLQNHGTTDFNNDNDAGYDLTGGWFDCGDHVMFGQTQFYSAYILLKGYDLWPAGYGDYYSQNYAGYYAAKDYSWEGKGHDPDGIPDILNEVKYATDFFIRCTRSAVKFYSQKGQGTLDHKHWVTSIKMATLGTGEGGQPRVMYSNVKDASMASFCGATLALMSRKYRQFDAAYADTCLVHAKLAYAYAKANPGTAGSPENAFYGANAKWQDDYASLCTELYYATNDGAYKNEALGFENNLVNHNYCFGYNDNDDIAAYNLATLGSAKSKTLLANLVTFYKGKVDATGLFNGGDTKWGVLRYNGNSAFIVAANNVLNNGTGVDPFIYRQVDYIMGSNVPKVAFIVGFGANSAKYPHHRNVFLNDGDVSNTTVINIPARNTQFGYLVGGVRSGSFTDARDNYITGEGGIDYSACLVGVLAYILSQTATVPPTGVLLAPKPLAVSLNGKLGITASFKPAGATSILTWSSRNASIASVDANGVVTGVAIGSTYVIAKTTNNLVDSTLVTVTKVNVTGVTLTPATLALTVGNVSKLSALILPSNASNQSVTWSSSDNAVASVASDGSVTALGIGTAKITATTVEGAFVGSSTVTVTPNLSTVFATKVTTPLTIDGALDESSWLLDKTITKTVSGTLNNTETFGLLWDDTYLYVGVKVLDATITTSNTNNYDNDGVEIYFDMNNNGGAYEAGDRQWIKMANAAAVWEQAARNTGVKAVTKIITGGYTVEFAIPWTNFAITPSTSFLYGFDIAINDADGGTTRNNQVVWMGTATDYNNLTAVGDLKLMPGTAPKIQNIPLKTGWNIISLNVAPADSSIATVFANIMPKVTEIKTLTSYYRSGMDAAFQTLTKLTRGQAYLVYVTSDVTLSVTGTPINLPMPILNPGWNLVAAAKQAPVAVPTDLGTQASSVSVVKNMTVTWAPNASINSLQEITPTEGYFIFVK